MNVYLIFRHYVTGSTSTSRLDILVFTTFLFENLSDYIFIVFRHYYLVQAMLTTL